MQIHILPALSDNYIYVLENPKHKHVYVVDPSESNPVLDFIEKNGLTVAAILNTHHHYDHIGGNQEIQQQTGCKIIGYQGDQHRIDLDQPVEDGETIMLDDTAFQILHIPGHTLGHIAYYSEALEWVFAGDTLFSIGCGRMFEGTPKQMYNSLQRLASLPLSTQLYCGHEYTLHNGAFASILEPNNRDLQQRLAEAKSCRDKGEPTLPSTMEQELQTNPFLRADSQAIRAHLGMEDQSDLDVFTKIRQLKDQF